MIQTKIFHYKEMGMKNNQGLHVMFAENLYSIGFKALKPLPLILRKMLEEPNILGIVRLRTS